ncbi:MAG: hypothetical protein ACU0BK_10855 [Shimia sp.]|uniref:hypothetical protein n=1 Tax=Shimia sp. TaxID=1954381 RepID=UPI00405996F0
MPETELVTLSGELEALTPSSEETLEMPDLFAAFGALVQSLQDTLRDTNVVQRAHEALASMIVAIVLKPDAGAKDGYTITSHANYNYILISYGGFQKEMLPEAVGLTGSQFSVVARGTQPPLSNRVAMQCLTASDTLPTSTTE